MGKKVLLRRIPKPENETMEILRKGKKEDSNKKKIVKKKESKDEPEFFCIFCTKYFISEKFLKQHYRSKQHKTKMKESKDKINNKSKILKGKFREKKIPMDIE